MFKKFAMLISFLLFFASKAEKFRGIEEYKLSNGLTVVIINTDKSNLLLVLLCVAAGSTDEIDRRGVANVLSGLFLEKLRSSLGTDYPQYGAECNSFTGYDQSVYYFSGKSENMEGFIKILGTVFSNFSFSSEELEGCKRGVHQKISEDQQVDRNQERCEARKSLWWHSNYGAPITGSRHDVNSITVENVESFFGNSYANCRATIIISGCNVDKKLVQEWILKYFSKPNVVSPINRLIEPNHHGATVQISKYSSQVSVPIVEMYWKIPCYRKEKEKAMATEIFLNHVDEVLLHRMIEGQKVAVSISFRYSFWNYEYGDFCIAVTFKNSEDVNRGITALLTELKYIAAEGLSESDFNKARKKLCDSVDIFNANTDVVTVVDSVAKKMGAGYMLDDIKFHRENVSKYGNLPEVNLQVNEIFRKDPCVISIIKPLGK
ncbi:MAG: insulinase family protein [Holosporaceae bacterium]|jgi:zinc protease|nr:insulinase family protein [Holosporaceae bacterium]